MSLKKYEDLFSLFVDKDLDYDINLVRMISTGGFCLEEEEEEKKREEEFSFYRLNNR